MYFLIKLKIAQKFWLGSDLKKSKNWSKFSKISNFQSPFSPKFARWGYPFFTQGCREKIRESPHIFLRSRWLSLGTILGQKRKWNTDLDTWSVLFGNFFSSKKKFLGIPTRCSDRYFFSFFGPKPLLNKTTLTETGHEGILWFFLYNPSGDWGNLALWSLEKNEFEKSRILEIWFSILAKFWPSLSQNFLQ